MSTDCPDDSWAKSNTICHAVTATTGTDAACVWLRLFGFGAIMAAFASAYSAYAPVKRSLVTPKTSSPTLNCSTPGPMESITPERSEPNTKGRAGGGAHLPLRIEASDGPIPAAL